ncbi:Crp/Fnr family transcriptional regulator [Eisenibacter elegans]|uniref:Crp/Fnr family transcriptional regulator n=1 Tax=Eisenibacter elegans TaxID=997 RepID=UPI000412507A|nr:Crp/Fnr family transcriptional regulator [Eisenibacter elegans]
MDLFNHLTAEEALTLKEMFEYKKFSKGDFIIKENDTVKHIYFILSGLVKLSYIDEGAKEFILSFAFEQWWETDFAAFCNQDKATLSLQCLEDTVVYGLNYDSYFVFLEKHKLSNYFLEKSIKGHIASQRRILSLLALSPKERYEQFVQLYPTLIQRVPKSVLALYLGVSRETLSRLYRRAKK